MRALYYLRSWEGAFFLFDPCSSLSFGHLSRSPIKCAYATASVSNTCRKLLVLVPDVFCCRGVHSLLGHVGSMIAYALKSTCNENQVQVAAQLSRVLCHAVDELPADIGVQFIQRFVTINYGTAKIDIFPNKRVDAILKHGHRLLVHRLDPINFRQRRMLIQFPRAPRNRCRLICHPLEV